MRGVVRVLIALVLAGWQLVAPGTRSVCVCLCGRGGICWDLDVPGVDCCKVAERHEHDGGEHACNECRGGVWGHEAWTADEACGCKHLEVLSAQAGVVRAARPALYDSSWFVAWTVPLVTSIGVDSAGGERCECGAVAPGFQAAPLVLRC